MVEWLSSEASGHTYSTFYIDYSPAPPSSVTIFTRLPMDRDFRGLFGVLF